MRPRLPFLGSVRDLSTENLNPFLALEQTQAAISKTASRQPNYSRASVFVHSLNVGNHSVKALSMMPCCACWWQRRTDAVLV